MAKKKILIVSSAFYPEISPRSFRATELAKEFVRQGHDVAVLTLFRGNAYDEFRKGNPNIEIKTFSPLRFPFFSNSGSGFINLLKRGTNRILSQLFEYPSIELVFKVASALKVEKNYDILISVAVPHTIHWGVAKTWSENRRIAKVWIADCGDPYMGANLDSFKKMFYFKYIEKWFCRKTDFISIPFEGLQNYFYPEFKNKIIVIPQGVRFENIKRFDRPLNNSIPTFAFAGSIIPKIRDLKKFLQLLVSLNRSFKFTVYTRQAKYFEPFIKGLDGKLIIHDYIPREQLIYELSKCDFLVNVDTIFDSENTLVAIPSKLIDYALSGRPILNIHSDRHDLKTINEFLNGEYHNQRNIELSKYNIKNVAGQFLQLTDSKFN